MNKLLSLTFFINFFLIKCSTNKKLTSKSNTQSIFVNMFSSFLKRIIIESHWFEYNFFFLILIVHFLIDLKNSIKNRKSSIMFDEMSMFAIQTNLRNLLINFLNKTTIFFICFSLFESMSISKLLLNEKKFSTLYALCFLFLFMNFLIYCFSIHFFNFFKKSQFAILSDCLIVKKTDFVVKFSSICMRSKFDNWITFCAIVTSTSFLQHWISLVERYKYQISSIEYLHFHFWMIAELWARYWTSKLYCQIISILYAIKSLQLNNIMRICHMNFIFAILNFFRQALQISCLKYRLFAFSLLNDCWIVNETLSEQTLQSNHLDFICNQIFTTE